MEPTPLPARVSMGAAHANRWTDTALVVEEKIGPSGARNSPRHSKGSCMRCIAIAVALASLVVVPGSGRSPDPPLAPTNEQMVLYDIEVRRLVTLLRVEPDITIADVDAGLGAWSRLRGQTATRAPGPAGGESADPGRLTRPDRAREHRGSAATGRVRDRDRILVHVQPDEQRSRLGHGCPPGTQRCGSGRQANPRDNRRSACSGSHSV